VPGDRQTHDIGCDEATRRVDAGDSPARDAQACHLAMLDDVDAGGAGRTAVLASGGRTGSSR
jgi:hypothetical protein